MFHVPWAVLRKGGLGRDASAASILALISEGIVKSHQVGLPLVWFCLKGK